MRLDHLNDGEMALLQIAMGTHLDVMRKRVEGNPAELAAAEALKFKLRPTQEEAPRIQENGSSTITADSGDLRSRMSAVSGGGSVPTARIPRT